MKIIALAALGGLLTVVGVHFGPRYLYTYLGDMALSPAADQLSDQQRRALQGRLKGLQARVVWSSSRSGSHEIYLLTLPQFEIKRLTRNDRVDFFPRFSPDGRRIVLARSTQNWVSERNYDQWDAYILDLTTGKETPAARHANYPQWVDNQSISFIRGKQVVIRRLDNGSEQVILDGGSPKVDSWIQTPELSPRDANLLAFTARGKLRGVYVGNLADKTFSRLGRGCEITWTPDGGSLLWVDSGGQGVTKVVKSALRPVKQHDFIDLPGNFSHEYFPRLSRDGRWLVWGASEGGHEHDIADYEIFLWDVSRPAKEAIRLTYNQGNDRWPDIFIGPGH